VTVTVTNLLLLARRSLPRADVEAAPGLHACWDAPRVLECLGVPVSLREPVRGPRDDPLAAMGQGSGSGGTTSLSLRVAMCDTCLQDLESLLQALARCV
jgi:hypothetical protein